MDTELNIRCGGRIVSVEIVDMSSSRLYVAPQLSDFVPLKNGFDSFCAQTYYHRVLIILHARTVRALRLRLLQVQHRSERVMREISPPCS